MIPGEALLIPLYVLFKNVNMLNSYYDLILPSIAAPFGVLLIKQFFDGLPNAFMAFHKYYFTDHSSRNTFFQFVVP
jgi:ABC-type glycerol-3-phosphate transport system permease component